MNPARETGSAGYLRIEPSRSWASVKWKELWDYRELLYFFTVRDIKVRYKQTAVGAAWAIIQPLMSMLIFTLIFGRLAKMPSDGIPYPIFSFSGLVPWTFFATSLQGASLSVVGNARLLTKVYFPRLTIPVAPVLASTVDFSISFVVLLGLMAYYHVTPNHHVIWVPAFLLLALITALGVGLWLAAVNVLYRDVQYVIPFLIQFWMYATPIVYPSSKLPDWARPIYGLNPMAGVVEGFRWALMDVETGPGPLLIVSAFAAVALLVGGIFYFRRMERSFADVV